MNATAISSSLATAAGRAIAAARESAQSFAPLTLRAALGWLATGAVTFHLAYAVPALSFLLPLYLLAMWELSRAPSWRWAFRAGFVLGFCVFAPQLAFFWTLFGATAAALWFVLACWTGLFTLLAHVARRRFSPVTAAIAAPVLWLALEYFRSELYYLRFSWINVGYGLAGQLPGPLMNALGMFGVAFVLMALLSALSLCPSKWRWAGTLGVFGLLALLTHWPAHPSTTTNAKTLRAAGVQLEFPSDTAVVRALNTVAAKHPDTQLFMLSEYTFDGPVPAAVKDWCREHQAYLLVGAKEPVATNVYYNTAFVIGPKGDVVFQQDKIIPIQFMADGLPGRGQTVWDSPWGKLGICICYDLSYTRVTDELVRQGAEGILVPTMDVEDWGLYQHQLHARVAPTRAAEYNAPIFRLCSSGISQSVTTDGKVIASAPFPGDRAIMAGEVRLSEHTSLPLDRWLGPIAAAATGAWLFWLLALAVRNWQARLRTSSPT